MDGLVPVPCRQGGSYDSSAPAVPPPNARPDGPCPDTETTFHAGLLSGARVCFNGPMASFQKYTATGRHDLEPFWPSRQHHDFDRVCCRAMHARAL
ncbi:hypothetical protein ABT288_34790 [Streptomyces sp. NPDC001093]|uniref:hypothetical protein n=1 Tax=Streptomyces sp. NPDC001093 TaxID=3154376 RepID=UPI0033342FAD